MEADLREAHQLRDEQQVLTAAGARARSLLGPLWNDGEADWDTIEQVNEWSTRFHILVRRAGDGNQARVTSFRTRWAHLVTEERSRLMLHGPTHSLLQGYVEAYTEFLTVKQETESFLALNGTTAWGKGGKVGALNRMQQRIQHWQENVEELRPWCNWRVIRQQAVECRLGALVSAYEQGTVSSDALRQSFERGFLQWWSEEISQHEPALKQFFSPEHERKIQQFRDLDDRYTQMTRAEIQARLAARLQPPVNA